MSTASTRDVISRGAVILLRATRQQKQLIDRAVGATDRSRSEFMLEASCCELETVLLDRRYFTLSPVELRRSHAVQDRPPKRNAQLMRLLHTEPPWER